MDQIEQRLGWSVRRRMRVFLCCFSIVAATNPAPAQTAKAIIGDTLAVSLPVGSADSDFDGNGEVGFVDFLLFTQAYQTDHAQYDLNGDGVVDLTDFQRFVEFYGQTVGETPVEMVLTYIPNGTFMMGSSSSDSLAFDREWPQHEVTISKSFYLGRYEVTQRQWQAVMGSNPSSYRGEGKPVAKVTWDDVQEFVARLNAAAGNPLFRLPTEAEWEYASRAGTTTRWSFGDEENDLGDHAWYGGNNSPRSTKDVGLKLPNPWGLFDMHGNVEEWCQDWYGDYSDSTQTNPPGPESGSHRVLRSGIFYYSARSTRSAARHKASQRAAGGGIGFRVLRRAQ